MKIELSANDLNLLQQAVDSVTIQGKDAPVVSKLLTKITKAFEREVAKVNNNG